MANRKRAISIDSEATKAAIYAAGWSIHKLSLEMNRLGMFGTRSLTRCLQYGEMSLYTINDLKKLGVEVVVNGNQ